jgi:cytochrome c
MTAAAQVVAVFSLPRPAMTRLRPARSLACILLAASVLSACQRNSEPEDPALRAQRLAFEVCAYCHSSTPGGMHKVGPNLYGVFGRKAASAPGYDYSTALRESDLVWDEASLEAFLRSPSSVVPGSKMVNATVDPARRAAVIAYLKQQVPADSTP